jgi:hypothetical protein
MISVQETVLEVENLTTAFKLKQGWLRAIAISFLSITHPFTQPGQAGTKQVNLKI